MLSPSHARRALTNPRAGLRRLHQALYQPKLRAARLSWLSAITGAPEARLATFVAEIRRDTVFLASLQNAYQQHLAGYSPSIFDFMVTPDGNNLFFHPISLYAFIRTMHPASVVETGGTPGKTSAFILRALNRNGHGHLWTLDLPPPESNEPIAPNRSHSFRPSGVPSNWCVPAFLRDRQTLVLGNTQSTLPACLEQIGRVSLFHHDSDHSYSHMRWELETALPFSEFLWVDDRGSNSAWSDFAQAHGLTTYDFTSQGVARVDL